MGLYSYFRISKPSVQKVAPEDVPSTYRRLRNQTFWGATIAYSLFYVCRMTIGVVKQPLIDGGVLTAAELGIIGSAMMLVYAAGKFFNGFVCDYCNIKRFMAWGLGVSAAVNLLMGALGLLAPGSSAILFLVFVLFWGFGGWAQSMGAPPGIISLSRWFPLKQRGTYYSIFSATPYLGKFLSFILTGIVVGWLGWQFGFIFAALAGVFGVAVILRYVKDTPQSQGLPSAQEIACEEPLASDKVHTRTLHWKVFRNPGIWIIALSSAFVYITQYAVSDWGVLYLQKGKSFTLEQATQIIAFSEAFGIAGTLFAGWISDRLFGGNRIIPVICSGLLCMAALGLFLFTGGSYLLNIVYVALFSLAIGIVFCIVAGLMALDIVPRKATGAALGIVGISSYVAAGIQNIVSGFMIQNSSASGQYDFTSVSIFWLGACLLSFLLPVLSWPGMRKKIL
ncbi:MAG: MFS transporter [Bacteroidales bacterium]|nr:MFS transporter [Bacteroidales bacterium]